MILRSLTLAGGVACAAASSQFPEFSQQYAQRLGGAVDELSRFVEEFDADAATLSLGREEALIQLAQGGDIGSERADTMRETLTRHERLSAAEATLGQAGPFMRAYRASNLSDGELTRATWADFQPAVPLTFAGAVFAGFGFVVGLIGFSLVFGLFKALFRWRRPKAA